MPELCRSAPWFDLLAWPFGQTTPGHSVVMLLGGRDRWSRLCRWKGWGVLHFCNVGVISVRNHPERVVICDLHLSNHRDPLARPHSEARQSDMHNNAFSPTQFFRDLVRHPFRWLVPAAVITAVALGYAQVRKPKWDASQAMMIRSEATGDDERLGAFAGEDEMKQTQETILELSRSRGVLEAALAEVDPPADTKDMAKAVAKLRSSVAIGAPYGAEFGTTEIFYLTVEHVDRERALALADAVSRSLQARVQALRNSKAQSMIDELGRAAEVTRDDLDRATASLSAMEREVGSDLTELRNLLESSGGTSDLRAKLTNLETRIREARAARRTNEELLLVLDAAKRDTSQLLAAPNRLLLSQPALLRLRQGLVDVQLRTAQLLGNMSEQHPTVLASQARETTVQAQLHREIDVAARAVETEMRVNAAAVKDYQERLAATRSRADNLVGRRAEYGKLIAAVDQRTEIVRDAQQDLADARASQAAAQAASLITRLDQPQTPLHTGGPSKASIVLLGVVGGLLTGIGIVFLTVDSTPVPVEIATELPAASTAEAMTFQTSALEASAAPSVKEIPVPTPMPAPQDLDPPAAAPQSDTFATPGEATFKRALQLLETAGAGSH